MVGLRSGTSLALVAVGALLLASCSPGSSSSASPTPSSATPTPGPTASATPEPTGIVGSWTGLDWAVGGIDDGSWWVINDMLPWGDGYVGVGESRHQDAASEPGTWHMTSPAFFTAVDGLRWTIAQEDEPLDPNSGSADWLPARLVRVGDALLAVGFHSDSAVPNLWRSQDGSTWSPLDSPTWRDLWLPPNHLISIATGPAGLVAVGEVRSDCCTRGPAVIAHSADGQTWDRLGLSSAFDRAYLWDVATFAGGFVIVGRVGEADVVGAEPAVGVPAAWTSSDGMTWLPAEVEGSEAPGATLSTVIAGANGLFATGRQTATVERSGQDPLSGWVSTNGRSWQLLGEMGSDPPLTMYSAYVAGDGAHMVMFGRESCKTTELSAWTSLNGVTWTPLSFSGETSFLPVISGPICNDDGTEGSLVGALTISHAGVVPDGLVVVASSSAPTSPTYWFLTAIPR